MSTPLRSPPRSRHTDAAAMAALHNNSGSSTRGPMSPSLSAIHHSTGNSSVRRVPARGPIPSPSQSMASTPRDPPHLLHGTGASAAASDGHSASLSVMPAAPRTDHRRGALVATGARTAEVMQMGTFITSDAILFVVPMPDGHQVWTGEERGWIRVRDASSGDVLHQHHFKQGRQITAMVLSSNAKVVWVGHGDGAITAFDAIGRAPLAELVLHEKRVTSLGVSARLSRLISVGADGRVAFWDEHTMSCVAAVQVAAEALHSLAVDDAGGDVYLACNDGAVRVASLSALQLRPIELRASETDGAAATCLHLSDQHLWCGMADGTVSVWNVRAPGRDRVKARRDHHSPVTAIVSNAWEHKVWTTSAASGVVIYDTIAFQPIQCLAVNTARGRRAGDGGADATMCICGVSNANVWRVWTCSADGIVRTWLSQTTASPPSQTQPRELLEEGESAVAASLSAQLHEAEHALQAARREMEALRQSVDEGAGGGSSAATPNAESTDLRVENGVLHSKLHSITAQLEELQAAHAEATEQLKVTGASAASDRGALYRRSQECTELRAQVELQQQQLAERQQRLDELAAASTRRERAEQGELLAALRDKQDAQEEASSLRRELAAARQEHERDMASIRKQLESAEELSRARCQRLDEEHRAAAGNIDRLRRELTELEQHRSELIGDVAWKDQELSQRALEIRGLRDELDELVNRSLGAAAAASRTASAFDVGTLVALESGGRHTIASIESHVRFQVLGGMSAAFSTLVLLDRRARQSRVDAEVLRDELRRTEAQVEPLRAVEDQLTSLSAQLRDRDEEVAVLQQRLASEQNERRVAVTRRDEDVRCAQARFAADLEDALRQARAAEAEGSERVSALKSAHERELQQMRSEIMTQATNAEAHATTLNAELSGAKTRINELEDEMEERKEACRASDTRANSAEQELRMQKLEVARLKDELLHYTQAGHDSDRRTSTLLTRHSDEVATLSERIRLLETEVGALRQSLETERRAASDAKGAMQRCAAEHEELQQHAKQVEAAAAQAKHQARLQADTAAALEQQLHEATASASRQQLELQRAADSAALELEKQRLRAEFHAKEAAEHKAHATMLQQQRSEAVEKLTAEVADLSEQLRAARAAAAELKQTLSRERHDAAAQGSRDGASQELLAELRNKTEALLAAENSCRAMELKLTRIEEEAKRERAAAAEFRSELAEARENLSGLQRAHARELDDATQKLALAEESARKLQRQLQGAAKQNDELRAEMNNELERLRGELAGKAALLVKAQDAKERAESESQRQVALLQNEMTQMDAEVSSLQRQVHEGSHFSDRVIMQGELSELRHAVQQLQREVANRRQEVKDAEAAKLALESDFSTKLVGEQSAALQLRSDLERANVQLKIKSAAAASLERQLDEKDAEIKKIVSEQRISLDSAVNDLRTENSNLTRDNKRLTQEHTALLRQFDEVQHDAKVSFRNERLQLEQSIDDYKQQVATLQKELRLKSTEVTSLVKQLDEQEVAAGSRAKSERLQLASQLEEAQVQREALQQAIKVKHSENAAMRSQLEDKIEELTVKLRSDKFAFEKRIQELEHELHGAQREAKARAAETLTLRQRLADNETDATTRHKNDVAHLEKQCELLRDQHAMQQRDLKQKIGDIAALQRQLDECEVEYTLKWREERTVYEGEINDLKSRIAALNSAQAAKTSEADEVAGALKKVKNAQVRLATEKAMALAEADELREQCERLRTQVRDLQVALGDANDQHRRDEHDINQLRIRVENGVVEQEELRSQRQSLQKECTKLKQNIEVLETIVAELRAQTRELQAESNDASSLATANLKKAQDSVQECSRWQQQVDALVEERDQLRLRVEEARTDAAHFEEQLRLSRINAQATDLKHRDEVDTLKSRYEAQLAKERDTLYREVDTAGRSAQQTSTHLSEAQQIIAKQDAQLVDLRMKVVGLERNLESSNSSHASAGPALDTAYIERQLAVVSQLIRRAHETPTNVSRANTALDNVLDYILEQKRQFGGFTPTSASQIERSKSSYDKSTSDSYRKGFP